jgi:hypothetical protein
LLEETFEAGAVTRQRLVGILQAWDHRDFRLDWPIHCHIALSACFHGWIG